MQVLLHSLLAPYFHIITCSNGQAALNILKQLSTPIDLILSDVMMPVMDGFEFLKQLRQRGYTKHTPVIMLSGRSESKERVKCYKLGAQDYLTKPFNPEELEELVKKNLFPIHYSATW